jgi:PAS domain S-box-containing protein
MSPTTTYLRDKPSAIAPAVVGLLITVVTVSHLVEWTEPTAGLVVSLGVLAVLCVPLVLGTGWLLGRSFDPSEVHRIVGWSLGGAVPITLLAAIVVFYQATHGVALAHPLIVTSWVAGVGAIGGFLTGLYDVRRIRRHERYEQTSTRLRALIEASPVAIVAVDSDGVVTDWSQAATDLFGYEREEVVGEYYPLVPDHKQAEFTDHLNRVNAGETLSGVETQRQRADGSTVDVSVWSAPVERESAVDEHMIALVDITERKAKRRDLKLLSRAIEQADDAVIITDDDGVIEYVNDAFVEMFGYERAAVIGRTPRLLKSGEHDDAFYRQLWDTITDGEVFQSEVTNRRANGEQLDVELTIAPVEDDGEVTHYVAIERDITDRKRDNQRLEVLNRVLRHNVRNALTVVDGNARRIADHCDDTTVDVLVDSITNRADELRAAVEKARTVERAIDTDRTSAINVKTLFETVRETVLEDDTDATVIVDAPDDLWLTGNHVLEAALEEAIENAVEHGSTDSHPQTRGNAVEHGSTSSRSQACGNATEHGGEQPTVRLDAEARYERVALIVSDDGPGIPDHERDVLESGGESDLHHGSGLGLWVMQWVVTSLGGDVTITDGEDGGTTVTFTLPRAEPPSRPQRRHRSAD